MNLIWTPRSLATYEHIASYLLEKWGITSAKKFARQVDDLLVTLQAYPLLFSPCKDFPSFRKALVNKHTTLYYEIDGVNLVLLTFWSNAMDPESLGEEFSL